MPSTDDFNQTASINKCGCEYFLVCRCRDDSDKVVGYGVSRKSIDYKAEIICKTIPPIINEIKSGVYYCATDANGKNPVTIETMDLEGTVTLRGHNDGRIPNNLSHLPDCPEGICSNCQ